MCTYNPIPVSALWLGGDRQHESQDSVDVRFRHLWACRRAGRHRTKGKLEQERQISENQISDPAMPEARNHPLAFLLHRPRNSPFGSSQCGCFLLSCLIFSLAIELKTHSFIYCLTYHCHLTTWPSLSSREKRACFPAKGLPPC